MRLRTAALTLILNAAALGACQPKADGGAPVVEPVSAPVPPAAAPQPPVPAAFQGPLDARGTEPFWSLQIRKSGLVFERPDAAKLEQPNSGPVMQGAQATWTTGSLIATLVEGSCSDGMSDKTYSLTAEVRLGTETLKGCAEPAGG